MGAKSWNVLGSNAFSSRYQQLKNYYFWDLIKPSIAVYLSSNLKNLIPHKALTTVEMPHCQADNNKGDPK